MERTERDVLNHLIETCKDGERGFRYAANHVESAAIKALFLDIASQRDRFVEALLPHAHRLGGGNEGHGTAAAALHRGWITLMDTLKGHDEHAVLHEAERGETVALQAYKEALAEALAPITRQLVESQCREIETMQERLRTFETA